MATELVVEHNDSTIITEKELISYLDTFAGNNKLTEQEKKLFIGIARAFGLNPFKREIYAIAYGEGDKRKCSIITGYEVYLKRAETSGLLKGWKTEFPEKGVCRITINRKDWESPFIHEVFFEEAVQLTRDGNPNQSWTKMPRTMLRKVAIGQGFRLCFPSECGGMPYEESEIDLEPTIKNVTPPELSIERKLEQKKQEAWKIINRKRADGTSWYSKQYYDEKIEQMKSISALPIADQAMQFEAVIDEILRNEEEQNGK
jgi:phage recombination protein Bet